MERGSHVPLINRLPVKVSLLRFMNERVSGGENELLLIEVPPATDRAITVYLF